MQSSHIDMLKHIVDCCYHDQPSISTAAQTLLNMRMCGRDVITKQHNYRCVYRLHIHLALTYIGDMYTCLAMFLHKRRRVIYTKFVNHAIHHCEHQRPSQLSFRLTFLSFRPLAYLAVIGGGYTDLVSVRQSVVFAR